MAAQTSTPSRVPTGLGLVFVTVHLSAFLIVTVILFRHIQDLEQKLSDRRADIADLASSCGVGDQNHQTRKLRRLERSLDDFADTNENFLDTWKLVKSRQSGSVSALMSSVLHEQEQLLLQKCSGDIKICLTGGKGDVGPTGDTGLPGNSGPAGAVGISGIDGAKGSKGDTGVFGSAGSKGMKGVKGLTGPQGLGGDTGSVGPKGHPGPHGLQGSTGADGGHGDKGDKGAKGLKGTPGLKGNRGQQGDPGTSGLSGDVGDPGPAGPAAVYTGPVCQCLSAKTLPVIAGEANVSLTTTLADNEILTCNATGYPDPSVTWSKPTSCHALSRNGSLLSINSATFADGGQYTCTASNSAGHMTKDIVLSINGIRSCDLDQDDLCGWSHNTTRPNTWSLHAGSTPSAETGPSSDHTKGTAAGKYLYLETSGAHLNTAAVLVSPTLPAKNDVCLRFWYNMYGRDIGSLNVYTKTCQGVNTNVLRLIGNKGNTWLQSCFRVTSLDHDFNFLIEGVVGSGYRGDIGIDDIELSAGESCACVSIISECDFEQGFCTWSNDTATDDFDWTLNSGTTISVDTGPSGDHTSGGGKYVYVEATSHPGKTTKLVSQTLASGHSYCLDYWYHMYGATMGTLNVYTQNVNQIHTNPHTVATVTGNQGNQWKHNQVTIAMKTAPFQIVFEGVVGSGYASDIALDDVRLTSGACK